MCERIVTCDVCGGDGHFTANEGDRARGLTDCDCRACDGRGEIEVDTYAVTEEEIMEAAWGGIATCHRFVTYDQWRKPSKGA